MFVCRMDAVSIRAQSIDDRDAVLIDVVRVRTGHRMDLFGFEPQFRGDLRRGSIKRLIQGQIHGVIRKITGKLAAAPGNKDGIRDLADPGQQGLQIRFISDTEIARYFPFADTGRDGSSASRKRA